MRIESKCVQKLNSAYNYNNTLFIRLYVFLYEKNIYTCTVHIDKFDTHDKDVSFINFQIKTLCNFTM